MSSIDFDLIPEPFVDAITKLPRAILRPKIPLKVEYRNKIDDISFDCLVDSGADHNLFPAYIGERVGINVKSGVKTNSIGIGGKKIECFIHYVKLHNEHFAFDTFVTFSNEQNFPLLGREGFFDKFKEIKFDYVGNKIKLTLGPPIKIKRQMN